ncbi:MAG: hypothetical protein LBH77_02830 [Tannerella sp.]|jgi:hypothetical protein|nr:hypothetical protein [Tannerella sp.]
MIRINHLILIITALLTCFGCEDKETYNTSHPENGGIILTMDWSNITDIPPSACRAHLFSSGGTSQLFDLTNGTNNLVTEPGDGSLLVYNLAEQVTISGKKATIAPNNNGTGISPNPGHLFSYYGQVHTERDRDIALTASMKRQTSDFKLSLAIKPAAMISRVQQIDAEITGIASALDLETNALSEAAAVFVSLAKSAYYATTTIRLFGFDSSTGKILRLNIQLENGRTIQLEKDLSTLVTEFNPSRNSLFSLNADLYLSEENGLLDNWECNTESRYLSVSALEVTLPGNASGESIAITTDQSSWGYSLIAAGDWLTLTQTDTQLELSASENTEPIERQATIHISAGGLSETITVIQQQHIAKEYSDKEWTLLQRATIGNGINLILMGDGYTIKDMAKGTGKYEIDMRQTMEHFFSVYPYTRYRDYFNVYMVVAISNEEGISIKLPQTTVDTKFSSLWEGPYSTGIECDANTVFDYVKLISELSSANIHDLTVIMPINAYIYAGTCSMFHSPLPSNSYGYAEGFSISMCPVGWDFKETVVHEAGGHGFSKVRDEYIYRDETFPSEEREDVIKRKAEWGWYENLDFYDNILLTSWRGFANNPKYHMVGTFEGAAKYGKGIWRPEYNSCMNNNVLYFNAPTRWAQVRRIMRLAGFNYSFDRFLEEDMVPEYPTEIRSKGEFIPLAPPVIKMWDPDKTKRNNK